MRELNQEEISRILKEQDVNKKKDIIHSIMSDSFRSCIRGYVTVATGVGKTYWACTVIRGINQKNPQFTIGVVVPTSTLKTEFEKYIAKFELKNVDVYVINTYTMSAKIEKTHDVLIVDELHHAAGQSKYFSNTIPISKARAVLGLTATLKKEHHKFLKEKLGLKHIFNLNIDEARDLGITPDFEKYNIPVELTTEEKAEYVKHQQEYEKYIDYFSQVSDNPASFLFSLKGNKFTRNVRNLHHACSTLDLNEGQVLGLVRKWFNALQGRKKVLQEAANGKKLVVELCKRLDGKTINFLKDIEYAEEINRQLENSVVYHSKLTPKKAKEALAKFEADAQYLNTVNAVDEGYDLAAITYGVNAGYDSSELRSAQRIGRCVRYDPNNPNKIAKVFNIYVNDFTFMGTDYKSQQLVWLRSSQIGQRNIHWVKSIDECFN